MSDDFPFSFFLPADSNKNFVQSDLFENNASTPLPNTTPDDIINPVSNISKNSGTGPSVHHNDELSTLQKEILQLIKNQLPPEKYTPLFDNGLTLTSIADQSINFLASSGYQKDCIESDYHDLLASAVYSLLGKKYKVIVDFADNKKGPTRSNLLETLGQEKISVQQGKSKPKNATDSIFKLSLGPTQEDLITAAESKYLTHMSGKEKSLGIDPTKNFHNFIVGPSNSMAHATAKAIAQSPGKGGKYPTVYMFSDSGLGKTHLLHAIANEIHDHSPHLVVILISARDFMNEIVNAYAKNQIIDLRKKYSEKVDVLMIDDVHELSNKEATQNEFFHIFNELHHRGKQLIFTSDKKPHEIKGLPERLINRLQWGLVIDIQKPDLETRIAILKNKAHELDLFVGDDVLHCIASSIKNNIRELEGSLVKLEAYKNFVRREIDLDTVRDLLMLEAHQEKPPLNPEVIAKAVCAYYKVHLADLKSNSRKKEMARSRHVAMYLAQKMLNNCTLKDLGDFFGGKDHSSVIHAIKKIKQELQKNPDLAREIFDIEANLI